MIKKLAIPFFLGLFLISAACSKPATENVVAEDETISAESVVLPIDPLDSIPSVPAPKDSSYIKGMLDTALKLKYYIIDYYAINRKFPENLKILNYPGLTFVSTNIALPDGKKKELITGYLKDENIYVRYEPTSFGKQENPMLSLSASREFSKDRANIQWINDVLSCVAYATSTIGNETCKQLKDSADTSNPLRTYYILDDMISEEKIDEISKEAKAMMSANQKTSKKVATKSANK